MGSKRKKSEREKSPSYKRKRNAQYGNSKDDGGSGSKNVKWTAWPSLDVSDIYDEEELEDSNLSEIADLNSFHSPTPQDVQGMTTVSPPTQTSLSTAVHRWRQRRVNPKFPTSKQAVPRPIARPPVAVKPWSEQQLLEHMNKGSCNFTASSHDISINCVQGCFLGTSLACLLTGAAMVWILLSLNRCLQKRRGWYRLNGTELPESEVEGKNYFIEKPKILHL